jgi:hypothetical protein
MAGAGERPARWLRLVTLCAVTTLALGACGSTGAKATPTLGLEAIFALVRVIARRRAAPTRQSPPPGFGRRLAWLLSAGTVAPC